MRLKKLERAWKRGSFFALQSYLRLRDGASELPDWTWGHRRVLVLRPDGIGDAIVSTPVLAAISGVSPRLDIDVVGSPANAPFLQRLDFVRRVYLFDKRRKGEIVRLARALREERYDAVIDPRIIEPSMTGLMLMLTTGARYRFGVGGRGADGALTHVVPPTRGHIIELLAGFGPLFGVDPERVAARPIVPVGEDELTWAEGVWSSMGGAAPGRRLLVNVSAGEVPRVWPEDRFVAVMKALRASLSAPLRVAVIGAPSEWERVRRIAQATDSFPVATPDLGRLTAIVAGSEVVFTADTSVVHIASAFRRPVVAMYLQGTAERWGGFDVDGTNLESSDATLLSLPVEPVIQALIGMLEGARPRL
jgi:ADP-heptose:LPS heptosyltransferase